MLVLFLGFIPLSNYIFQLSPYAPIIYLVIPFSVLLKFSEANRNLFLKTIYSSKKKLQLRLTENLMVSTPFCAYLVYQSLYVHAAGAFSAAVGLAFLSFGKSLSFVVPTPFYKRPFEFILGFRKVFLFLPLAYALAVIGHFYNNYNLAIAAQILIFLLAISFYSFAEKEIYVWIFKLKPEAFLMRKLKTAAIYVSVLTFPVIAFIGLVSLQDLELLLLIQLLGYAFLSAVVLAKYASVPEKISIPHGIMIGVCIPFPPLLLFVIPFLLRIAKKNLSPLLND